MFRSHEEGAAPPALVAIRRDLVKLGHLWPEVETLVVAAALRSGKTAPGNT